MHAAAGLYSGLCLMFQAAAEVLGELEDEKEANAAAQRRSNAATAQAAKLQMDLRALQQEAEQARQQAAAAAQDADARVSCRGQPGSVGLQDSGICQGFQP